MVASKVTQSFIQWQVVVVAVAEVVKARLPMSQEEDNPILEATPSNH